MNAEIDSPSLSSPEVPSTESAPTAPAALPVVELKRRECDIIMKGGITSGVVYPKLAVELGKFYDFRGIGGASAGAIAATATAAAQYYRNMTLPATDHSPAQEESLAAYNAFTQQPWNRGFGILEGIADNLATPESGSTRLFNLFQPSFFARPVFQTLVAFFQPGLSSKVPAFLLSPVYLWPGTLVLVLLLLIRFWLFRSLDVEPQSFNYLLWAIVFVLTLVATFAGLLIWALSTKGYGLCSGMGEGNGTARPVAATEWLHNSFQTIAGKKPGEDPLTFGDLSRKCINLALISTNLAHGQPYAFPYAGDVEFFYDPEEFAKYFPADVIAYLSRINAKEKDTTHGGKTLRIFPTGDVLPVLIPTRMSMAFPVVLSAIPLYSRRQDQRPQDPDHRYLPKSTFERCWFSDGGISSNLPVHFFDGPIPSRPTFIVNLAAPETFEAGETGAPSKLRGDAPISNPTYRENDDVAQVSALVEKIVENRNAALAANPEGAQDSNIRLKFGYRSWNLFDHRPAHERPFGFAAAIFGAARNWNDNAQIAVPGYRERTFNIVIKKDLGGLNLKMTQDQITELGNLGLAAAADIILEYRLPPDESWQIHQWVRFRSTSSLLGKHIENLLEKSYAIDTLYQAWLAGAPPPNVHNKDWDDLRRPLYEGVYARLLDVAHITNPQWEPDVASKLPKNCADPAPLPKAESFYGDEPTPVPVIRVRPRL